MMSPPLRRQRSESSDGSWVVPEAAGTAGGAAGTAGMQAAGTAGVQAAGTSGIAGVQAAGTARWAAGSADDRLPEPCTGDRSTWPEWSFVAKAYFVSQGLMTPDEVQKIEAWPMPIDFSHCSAEQLTRSRILYYRLVQIVRGHALRVIQPVPDEEEGEQL